MVCWLFVGSFTFASVFAYLGGQAVIADFMHGPRAYAAAVPDPRPGHHLPARLAARVDRDHHHLHPDLPAAARALRHRPAVLRHPDRAQPAVGVPVAADGDVVLLSQGHRAAARAADADLLGLSRPISSSSSSRWSSSTCSRRSSTGCPMPSTARRARPPEAALDLGAVALRDRLAAGALKAADLAEAAIARIEATEPELRAWAWFDPEFVRAQAKALDAHRATGRPIGPLHGVPVGIKDIIDTARIPTENGTALDAGRVPREDAFVVARLKAAGALILGKTATTELAFFSPAPTRNPANPAHTPGGSSAGSAAAVAAGQAPLAVGTQTAGSVIRPAAFCGVVGFKPSFGAMPRTGILAQSPSLDTVGVFARTRPGRGAPRRDALRPRPARPRHRARRRRRASSRPRPHGRRCPGLRLRPAARLGRRRSRHPGGARGARRAPRRAVLRGAAAPRLRRGGGDPRADQPRRAGQVLPPLRAPRPRRALRAAPGRDRRRQGDPGARLHRGARLAGGAERRARGGLRPLRRDPGPSGAGAGARGARRDRQSDLQRALDALRHACGDDPGAQASNGLPMGVQLVGRRGDDGRLLRTARWLMEHVAGDPEGGAR